MGSFAYLQGCRGFYGVVKTTSWPDILQEANAKKETESFIISKDYFALPMYFVQEKQWCQSFKGGKPTASKTQPQTNVLLNGQHFKGEGVGSQGSIISACCLLSLICLEKKVRHELGL